MPTFSVQLPDQIFPFPFSLPSPWPSSGCPLLTQEIWRKGWSWGKWPLTFMSLWEDAGQWQIGDSPQVTGFCLHCQPGKGMLFMTLTSQLCNLKHFAIFFSKSFKMLRANKKKAGTQTQNVHKAHDSNACAKEIWHVWTPLPEKTDFSLLSSPFSFFSSRCPTTSWGLSHCGLYFYQQWNTETTFTAAELISCLEFGFLKVSCLPLESSHSCTQPQTCTQRMLLVLWL